MTTDTHYDAIVVGSGAAGSIAVKELTERGLDVLLLEAGRDISDADFPPPRPGAGPPGGINIRPRLRAALRGQSIQSRRAFFNDRVNGLLVSDREHPYGTEGGDTFLWIRGRQLGGRLHTYGRVLLRMSDYDFKAADYDGQGEDWPISYADLIPYYESVERLLGVWGTKEDLPQLPDSIYAGTPKLNATEREFKAKVEERWPERRVIPWRSTSANPERVPVGILVARKTGRLTTRTDAIVRQITVDSQTGLADGAVFIDRLTKQEHQVSADSVMLCASTIESVRLMLASACDAHPNGLGGSSGLLGRYFGDQMPSLVFGSVSHRTGFERAESAPGDSFYPSTGGVYMPRFENLDARTQTSYPRGFALQGAIGRLPVPEDTPSNFGLMGFGQLVPRKENRITLSTRIKDAFGLASPNVRLTLDESDRALAREQVRATREMAEYCGYRVDFAGSALGLDSRRVYPNVDRLSRWMFLLNAKKSMAVGAAIHECGGARMGSDPAASVLNEYNQCWDVPNLFVTDGSCFVSSGDVGPTLTIMAITARACEHLAREHQSGSLHTGKAKRA